MVERKIGLIKGIHFPQLLEEVDQLFFRSATSYLLHSSVLKTEVHGNSFLNHKINKKCNVSRNLRWISSNHFFSLCVTSASWKHFVSFVSARSQAGRDESDHVDEAQAILDAKASRHIIFLAWLLQFQLRLSCLGLFFLLNTCDSRRSTRPVRLDGARTRSSSSRCSAWGTETIYCEVPWLHMLFMLYTSNVTLCGFLVLCVTSVYLKLA